jgi:hypothetical protein
MGIRRRERHNSRRTGHPHPGMRRTGCTSPRAALKSRPERYCGVLCVRPHASRAGQGRLHAHHAPPLVARLLPVTSPVTDDPFLVKAHNLPGSADRDRPVSPPDPRSRLAPGPRASRVEAGLVRRRTSRPGQGGWDWICCDNAPFADPPPGTLLDPAVHVPRVWVPDAPRVVCTMYSATGWWDSGIAGPERAGPGGGRRQRDHGNHRGDRNHHHHSASRDRVLTIVSLPRDFYLTDKSIKESPTIAAARPRLFTARIVYGREAAMPMPGTAHAASLPVLSGSQRHGRVAPSTRGGPRPSAGDPSRTGGRSTR